MCFVLGSARVRYSSDSAATIFVRERKMREGQKRNRLSGKREAVAASAVNEINEALWRSCRKWWKWAFPIPSVSYATPRGILQS